MGGSKTTSETKTKIPQEIRERGTTITNAAMSGYFNPTGRYTPYQYGGSGQQPNYTPVSQSNPYSQGSVTNGQTQTGGAYSQSASHPTNGQYTYQPINQGATWTETTGGQQQPSYNYANNNWIAGGGNTGGTQTTPSYAGQTPTSYNEHGDPMYSYAPQQTTPQVTKTGTGGYISNKGVVSPNTGTPTGIPGVNLLTMNKKGEGTYSYDPGPDYGFGGMNAGNWDWSGTGEATTGSLNAFHDQAGINIGQANNIYNQAAGGYQDYLNGATLAGTDAWWNNQVAGPNYTTENINRFMNPYDNLVIGQGVRDIGTAMQQQRLQDQSRAAQANAFGGTRHAVLDNLNAASAMQTLSDFVGSQRQQGFNQAVGQYNTDYGQGLQAAGQNFNQGMSYADLLSKLGTQQQTQDLAAGDAQLKAADASIALGNIYTARDEAAKQNAYQYGYLDARNFPLEVYERMAGINAMQPVNRTSTTTTSQSGGWLGPAIGAVGSIFASDERLKEDVHDRDPEKVLGAFSKVRPKTYSYTDEAREAFPDVTADGERRGFIAQDYAKAFKRDNVDLGGGIQGMDVANVLGDLVAAVHGLEARTRKLKKRAV